MPTTKKPPVTPAEKRSSQEPARRARLQRLREIWGRRSVAIGVLLVSLALIGGLVLLITGDGDDDERASGSQPTQQVQDLQEKFLKKTVVLPDDGISVRRPGSWTDDKNNGVIILRSDDRCVAVNLSAPTDAKGAKSLRTDSITALRQNFKNVQVSAGGHAKVGGIPTTTNAITLKDDEGNRRRVLLSIGTGKKKAYLTEVVLGNPSCQADLQLAQLVLTSVQYTK